MRSFKTYVLILCVGLALTAASSSFARTLEYHDEEVAVYVNPGEPTMVQFPGSISGGFKKKQSTVSLDRRGTDLMLFAQENLPDSGEALFVRLDDGRSYSVRVMKASSSNPRDDVVKVEDGRGSVASFNKSEEEPAFKEKIYEYAPPSQVSGLMREMVLNAEFGKNSIAGYRVSDRYRGQIVLDDGAMRAVVDKVYIGSNLWGYVIDAENLLDQTQQIEPSTFRLDGTRAISATNWELTPRATNVEEKVANKHTAKIYVITRAK